MKVVCATCRVEFNKPPCHVRRVKVVYCSRSCHDAAQTLYPSKLCAVCGLPFKVGGRMEKYVTCPSPECRTTKKRGANNGNWRGGVTPLRKRDMSTAQYRNWRTAVFRRDDYTCQMCGHRGGDIQADHIKPWAYFPELRYEESNGRVLCLPCHQSTYKDVFKWRPVAG